MKRNKTKKVLDLNNDTDYEEYIRLQNLPPLVPSVRKTLPGQFRTLVPKSMENQDD